MMRSMLTNLGRNSRPTMMKFGTGTTTATKTNNHYVRQLTMPAVTTTTIHNNHFISNETTLNNHYHYHYRPTAFFHTASQSQLPFTSSVMSSCNNNLIRYNNNDMSDNRALFSTTSISSSSSEMISEPTSSLPLPHMGVAPEDMPFLHHGRRPRYRNYIKHKNPRKKASKLFHDLTVETIEASKANKPEVFDVDFRVGDAIEFEVIENGGINNMKSLNKVRGVVIGIYNKKMDTGVLIRDIVKGVAIERRIKLHSPLVKSCKLLEKNFVYKGRRKVKKKKLYYLRNRNQSESRVTKVKGK